MKFDYSLGKSGKIKNPLSMRFAFAIAFIFFVLYCSYIIFFFIFGFILGVKQDGIVIASELDSGLIFSFPKEAAFSNFWEAIVHWGEFTGTVSYVESFWNSLWRSFVSTFINWFCTTVVCYILVHYRSKFTRGIYLLGLFLTMIPLYGAGAAEWKLFSQTQGIGIMDTPFIYISNITLFGSNFFYMYAFWKAISWDYAEAALIDGSSDLGIFFKVMLPMVIPSSIALFIMLFIGNWNNYEYTAIYMTKYPDLAYGIYSFDSSNQYSSQWTALFFASVLLSFTPIVVLFISFQNTIMEKVYLGGLKG